MSEVLHYKGYVGSIEYSETDGVLFGEVLGIRSLILYEGNSAKELVTDFQESIDDYLDVCEREGSEPETACIETFKVQLETSLYRRAAIYSENAGKNINSFIAQAIEEKLMRVEEAARRPVRA